MKKEGETMNQIILRAAICEDVTSDAERIAEYVRASGFQSSISCFVSGEAFLESHPWKKFDIVFFDIYMDDISGIETARRLREYDKDCMIIFTTTSREHALDAFRVDAVQYLIKPVEQQDISSLLKKLLDSLSQKKIETVPLNLRGTHCEIPVDNIRYVEAKNHNCLVHTTPDVLETGSSMKMSDFERLLLPPRFLNCHRAYIVNLSYVAEIDRDFEMQGGGVAYIRCGDVAKCAKAYKKWLLYEAGRDSD